MWRVALCACVVGLLLWACAAPRSRGLDPPAAAGSLTVAELLGAEASGPGRQLVALAQQRLGSPYRYGGADPAGFDCSGLVYFVHREAGYAVPRTSSAQFRAARKVAVRQLSPGDLVFFNVSAGKVSHVGIYVDEAVFIHSPSSGKGVSYASLAESYWQERLVGAGRFY